MNERLDRLFRFPPAGRHRAHAPPAVIADAVMRKARAQNASLLEPEFFGELANLFLVVVDKLAAGLAVETAEAVPHREDPAADAAAGLEHDDARAAALERMRRRQAGEPRADDDDRRNRQDPPPFIVKALT